jgi:predicted metalloprotease with PDZ domain
MQPRKSTFLLLFLLSVSAAAWAGPPVDYYVSLINPQQHLIHVRVHLAGTSAERDVQLPAWNALYQIRDFAQNLRSVHATDASGRPLPIRKLDKTTWRISQAESGAELGYDVYVDSPGPFGAQYDREHAFFNLAQILVYPLDARDSLMTVTFTNLPPEWQVATALASLRPGEPSARGIFTARNYDRLVDAPIELGTFKETSFEEGGALYRIAVHADVADYSMDKIKDALQRIVRAETRWMDDRPYGEYLFIYHFPHSPGAGGMEHAYSTAIEVSAERLQEDFLSMAGTTAHEFFHLWNVKRIRPSTLEPIDYVHENYTRALWFSEGVTSTVADYTLLQGGLAEPKRFLVDLSNEIRTLQSRPAHLTQSAEDSSLDTWFDKYPQYRLPDRSISYYNKGEILGVMLDLELRRRSKGKKSLQDLFQWMNRTYAYGSRYFHDTEGVREAAGTVCGCDMNQFFDKYVTGLDEVPYNDFFRYVGLQLVEKRVTTPAAGFLAVKNFDNPPVVVFVEEGSEAQKAGLMEGDTIGAVNGKPPVREIAELIGEMAPGAILSLRVNGHKGTRKIDFALGSQSSLSYSITDLDKVTSAQRAHRAAWLGGVKESAAALANAGEAGE